MEHPRERSDDSQGPSSSSTAYERIGGSLFAGKGFTPSRTPSMRERERDGASVVGSIGSGIEMEEWTPSERPTQICVRSVGSHVDSVNSPPESVGPRGSPAAHVAPVVLHTTAPLHISKAPRTRGGTWSRKNSNMSERSGHPLFTHPDTPAPWQQQRPPIMVSGHYESQDPFVSLVSEGKPHAYATTENWAIVRPQVEEVMVLSPKRGEEYVFA
ncbi:hypothetical protein C8J57DRAFT_1304989 [Mycena rebaudengoi]|nr:hypothetical protein C8J57DRAFT_1304989 [Mycena rebaudengoi]